MLFSVVSFEGVPVVSHVQTNFETSASHLAHQRACVCTACRLAYCRAFCAATVSCTDNFYGDCTCSCARSCYGGKAHRSTPEQTTQAGKQCSFEHCEQAVLFGFRHCQMHLFAVQLPSSYQQLLHLVLSPSDRVMQDVVQSRLFELTIHLNMHCWMAAFIVLCLSRKIVRSCRFPHAPRGNVRMVPDGLYGVDTLWADTFLTLK